MMMAPWLSAVLIVFLLPAAHSQTLMDILFGPDRSSGGTGTSGTSALSSGTGGSSISSSSGSSAGPIATFNPAALSSGGSSISQGYNSITSLTTVGSGQTGSPSGGQSRPSPAGQPYCSAAERRLLFRSCAMSFGMAHMRHFEYLSRKPTCDIRVFNCREVDNLIRCVNSQTVQMVSNRCWPLVDKALTSFLHQYNLPCAYQDLKTKCEKTSADILPMHQRQQQGQGMNTNPMTAIMPMIRRAVMPMIMMMTMGGGGMGGLFGA